MQPATAAMETMFVEEEEEETGSVNHIPLFTVLQTLALVQEQSPNEFNRFFHALQQGNASRTDVELLDEILAMGQRAKELKQAKASPSLLTSLWQRMAPSSVQNMVSQDTIRKQLLFDPNKEEEEEEEEAEAESVPIQEFALEIKQAVVSGVLLNNVLDLSEQIISTHFGVEEMDRREELTKTQRVLSMSRQIMRGSNSSSLGISRLLPIGSGMSKWFGEASLQSTHQEEADDDEEEEEID